MKMKNMKRSEQLLKLSREHHGSLVMAKKIALIAEEGTDQALMEALEAVKAYYDDELEEHFQHEERTIFAPIFRQYPELKEMATVLLKEHGFIRLLIPKMTGETVKQDLADFALVLKNHTRMEERELFPIIEKSFSDEQMDAVLNFVPLD